MHTGILRRQGRYIFAARNYTPRRIEGEIDLVGYDGKTLAFVEVRTRTIREDLPALPELSINREEQHVVVRTAQRFLAERHVRECPCRFDVMAMDNCPGQPPVERLHRDAFSPQMCGAWREGGKIFTLTPDEVQFKVSGLLTLRG